MQKFILLFLHLNGKVSYFFGMVSTFFAAWVGHLTFWTEGNQKSILVVSLIVILQLNIKFLQRTVSKSNV